MVSVRQVSGGRSRYLTAAAVCASQARAGIASISDGGNDPASLIGAVRDALGPDLAAQGVCPHELCREMSPDSHTGVVIDPVMVRTYGLLRKLAGGDISVLLQGETGAGKELAARAVHAWSRRAAGPLVVLNCAALPESLVESELFGYVKGAFTGADRNKLGLLEAACSGTLFLDEVGELSLGAQAKLLRAIDAREVTRIGEITPRPVDFRLVAASNRDHAAETARGQFREDLYYRLAAATVIVPPLRDHPGDIPALARMFVARACEAMARSPLRLADTAMQLLLSYRFPGNVRELANAIDYGVATAAGDRIEPWDLPAGLGTGEPCSGEPGGQARFQPIAEEIADLEKRRMTEALAASGGNQSEAAKLIGMPRRTFVSKMSQYWLR